MQELCESFTRKTSDSSDWALRKWSSNGEVPNMGTSLGYAFSALICQLWWHPDAPNDSPYNVQIHQASRLLYSLIFCFAGYIVKSVDMRSIHNYNEPLETCMHIIVSYGVWIGIGAGRGINAVQMLLHTLFPHNVCYHFNQINEKERTTKHKEQT